MELVGLMKRWKELKDELAMVEAGIKAGVLTQKKSEKAEGVIATYSKGRRSFNYEGIAQSLEPSQAMVDEFTTTTTATNWKGVVDKMGVDLDDESMKEFTVQGNPSVSLRLEKPKVE